MAGFARHVAGAAIHVLLILAVVVVVTRFLRVAGARTA
ncbi:MAG TPA: DUF5670 family protein [Chloroflexota bacterium]|nr:DUF5670 family protein [Chloroflexota bacterium]